MKAISRYIIEGDKIYVFTPYSEQVAAQCREMGGKFDRGYNAWILSKSRLETVQLAIGRDQENLVQVEVTMDDVTNDDAQLRVGWHVLASRRYKNSRVELHAELVGGTIPDRGGSAKHPAVKPSKDARFRFWVPLEFAERNELMVVNDPVSDEELAPVACIIDQRLQNRLIDNNSPIVPDGAEILSDGEIASEPDVLKGRHLITDRLDPAWVLRASKVTVVFDDETTRTYEIKEVTDG